eukprot:46554-Eustigmatos_ZCMA.PRE.1
MRMLVQRRQLSRLLSPDCILMRVLWEWLVFLIGHVAVVEDAAHAQPLCLVMQCRRLLTLALPERALLRVLMGAAVVASRSEITADGSATEAAHCHSTAGYYDATRNQRCCSCTHR